MALSIVQKTLKDGAGGTFTGNFASDGTNLWPLAVLANESGPLITDSGGLPVTALNAGAITNPTSTLTLPAAIAATSVTFSTPTFTGLTAANGTPVVLGGVTAPTGGNFTLGNVYYVVSTSSNTCQLAATYGGSGLTGSSAGTSLTLQPTYVPNALVASSLTSPTVPSLTIPIGFILARLRVTTNVAGVLASGSYGNSGWDGVGLSINLWNSPQPTYSGGDLQPYAPATNAASWLGTFQVSLLQYGDGASGSGGLIGAGQMAIKLGGTSVFWDVQIQKQVFRGASQTITLTAEPLN